MGRGIDKDIRLGPYREREICKRRQEKISNVLLRGPGDTILPTCPVSFSYYKTLIVYFIL